MKINPHIIKITNLQKYFLIKLVLLLGIFFNINLELKSQSRNSRYILSGEVNEANMSKWISDIDSIKGSAKGYELIRNVSNYCSRRTFYAEAYYILHKYKNTYTKDSNYFNYNMSYLEHLIAASNIDSTKIPYLEKYLKIKSNTLEGFLALKRR